MGCFFVGLPRGLAREYHIDARRDAPVPENVQLFMASQESGACTVVCLEAPDDERQSHQTNSG